jgi:hypothetical protein
MIPPGIHFIYMRFFFLIKKIYLFSVPRAPKIAFFHNFEPKEIVLRKWNKSNEDLFDYVSDDVEV